jgi:hypothetical protein
MWSKINQIISGGVFGCFWNGSASQEFPFPRELRRPQGFRVVTILNSAQHPLRVQTGVIGFERGVGNRELNRLR